MFEKNQTMKKLLLVLSLFAFFSCSQEDDVTLKKMANNDTCVMKSWLGSTIIYSESGEVNEIQTGDTKISFERLQGIINKYRIDATPVLIEYDVTYDQNGLLSKISNESTESRFEYKNGRVSKFVLSENEYEVLEYDGSNVSKVTSYKYNDYTKTTESSVTTFTYDNNPNPFKVFRNTPYYTVIGQSDNNVVEMVKNEGSTKYVYEYNENGLPVSVESTHNSSNINYDITYLCH